jgi:hypothetical protein
VQPQPVIELSGTLTLGELARFQYFHTLRRTWPAILFVLPFLLVLLPFLVIEGLTNPESNWGAVLSNAAPFFVLLVLWLLFLLYMPTRQARKQHRSQKYLHEPITYRFSREGVSGTGPSISWKLTWDIFKVVRETKSLFVMYQGPNVAIVVPKRFFADPSAVDEWRRLVSSSMSKAIEEPGVAGRRC